MDRFFHLALCLNGNEPFLAITAHRASSDLIEIGCRDEGLSRLKRETEIFESLGKRMTRRSRRCEISKRPGRGMWFPTPRKRAPCTALRPATSRCRELAAPGSCGCMARYDSPRIRRLFRQRSQPNLGRNSRLLFCSIRNCLGSDAALDAHCLAERFPKPPGWQRPLCTAHRSSPPRRVLLLTALLQRSRFKTGLPNTRKFGMAGIAYSIYTYIWSL